MAGSLSVIDGIILVCREAAKTVSVYRARVLAKMQLANNSDPPLYAICNGVVGS